MNEAARTGRNSRLQAMLGRGLVASTKVGTITSYDDKAYAVKVMVEPEGRETGWLPIELLFGGDGWGLFCGQTPGQQAVLLFQEDDPENGIMIGVLPSDDAKPPVIDGAGCPAGELWIVHQAGSRMRFLTDGTVETLSPVLMKMEAPAYSFTGLSGGTTEITIKGNITQTGNTTQIGNVALSGNIAGTGNATFTGTVTGGTDVIAGATNISGKSHRHTSAAAGNPTSAPLP